MRRRIQRQASEALTQLADAMHTDCQQRVNSVTDGVEQQPIKTHEEVVRDCALMDSVSGNHAEWLAHGAGFGLGFAVAAMMLADGKKMAQHLKELEEERPYAEEIRREDERFDKEIIRMSGFEW